MFEDIRRDIQAKTEEFEKQLIEQAVQIADTYYRNAIYAGDNDVNVISNGNEVIAEGNAPMFIEFGTGVRHPEVSGEVKEVIERAEGLQPHGHYGDGRGRSPKGWNYAPGLQRGNQPSADGPSKVAPGLIHTWGNDATPAMYFARKETIERAGEIGKKVFK